MTTNIISELEEKTNEEILNVLDSLENSLDYKIAKNLQDGVQDIPTYLANTYGIDLTEDDYRVQNIEANINALKIIQPGVELDKAIRMGRLNENQLKKLMKRKPLKVVGAKGLYLINGNHRLLSAQLRGIDTAQIEVYSITNKEIADEIGFQMLIQNKNVEQQYDHRNVNALRTSLCRQIALV